MMQQNYRCMNEFPRWPLKRRDNEKEETHLQALLRNAESRYAGWTHRSNNGLGEWMPDDFRDDLNDAMRKKRDHFDIGKSRDFWYCMQNGRR